MTLKDATAHKQGRRHIAALGKIDETLGVELEPESSAPPGFSVMGSKECKMSSKSLRGAKKMKEKTTLEPKSTVKKIVPPPISADLVDAQLDTEHTGWFMDSFPSDTYNNPDYSICDKDCGWCGRCMDEIALE